MYFAANFYILSAFCIHTLTSLSCVSYVCFTHYALLERPFAFCFHTLITFSLVSYVCLFTLCCSGLNFIGQHSVLFFDRTFVCLLLFFFFFLFDSYTLCILRLEFIVSSHSVCLRWPHHRVFRIFDHVFRGKFLIFCLHSVWAYVDLAFVCLVRLFLRIMHSSNRFYRPFAFCFHTLITFSFVSYVCWFTLCCSRLNSIGQHSVFVLWLHFRVSRMFVLHIMLFMTRFYCQFAFCLYTLITLSCVSYFGSCIIYFAANFTYCLHSVFIRWPHFRESRTFVFTHYALIEQIFRPFAFCFHTLITFQFVSYVCSFTLCCSGLNFIDQHSVFVLWLHFCVSRMFLHILLFKTRFNRQFALCLYTLTTPSCVSYFDNVFRGKMLYFVCIIPHFCVSRTFVLHIMHSSNRFYRPFAFCFHTSITFSFVSYVCLATLGCSRLNLSVSILFSYFDCTFMCLVCLVLLILLFMTRLYRQFAVCLHTLTSLSCVSRMFVFLHVMKSTTRVCRLSAFCFHTRWPHYRVSRMIVLHIMHFTTWFLSLVNILCSYVDLTVVSLVCFFLHSMHYFTSAFCYLASHANLCLRFIIRWQRD